MAEMRDRSVTTNQERLLHHYKQVCAARNNETMRVAELIEMAMHSAETEETQIALLDLAVKVLRP